MELKYWPIDEIQHAWQLAANSFEGSFIDVAAKRAYVDRLNAVFASF